MTPQQDEGPVNKEFLTALRTHGWKIQATKPRADRLSIAFCGNTAAVLRTMEETEQGNLKWVRSGGKSKLQNHEEGFTGGSYEGLKRSLVQGPDMEPYQAAKKKLTSSGLLGRVMPEEVLVSLRRRRRFSEHDGDWDYARRWDPTPFSTAMKQAHTIPKVELYCHMGVSCMVSAEEYDRFGALAWAVSEVLESAGFQVTITGFYGVSGVTYDPQVDTSVELTIKKPGEYVAPTVLASAFKTNFFRRAMFMMFCAAAEGAKTCESMGLGSPIEAPHRVHYEKGRITLGPTVASAPDKDIEAELLKAVKDQMKAKVT